MVCVSIILSRQWHLLVVLLPFCAICQETRQKVDLFRGRLCLWWKQRQSLRVRIWNPKRHMNEQKDSLLRAQSGETRASFVRGSWIDSQHLKCTESASESCGFLTAPHACVCLNGLPVFSQSLGCEVEGDVSGEIGHLRKISEQWKDSRFCCCWVARLCTSPTANRSSRGPQVSEVTLFWIFFMGLQWRKFYVYCFWDQTFLLFWSELHGRARTTGASLDKLPLDAPKTIVYPTIPIAAWLKLHQFFHFQIWQRRRQKLKLHIGFHKELRTLFVLKRFFHPFCGACFLSDHTTEQKLTERRTTKQMLCSVHTWQMDWQKLPSG